MTAHPPAPTAVPAPHHRVRVGGVPVFVERYEDVAYARFAMPGDPVAVEVEVEGPISRHEVFPPERVGGATVAGSVLAFDLAGPDAVVVWIDGLEKLFLLPDPPEVHPPVPGSPGVLDVTALGADPGGGTPATAVIQEAVDRASRLPGGGTVLLPAGVYRTGTLTLRSDVTLYLAPGALLQGSADPADYPVDSGRRESAADLSLTPDARFLGRTMTFSRLLLVDRARNVRIAGRGTIDGNGSVLRKDHGAAPNLLRIRESRGVVVEDVLFRNAAAWSLHVLASSHVRFDRVKVLNDRTNLNTDGIDPDMSTDVTIDRSFIYTKDDAICVKATGNGDLAGDPARITATNNLVSSLDAALKVGTESAASTISDVVFRDNHVFESGRAMSVVIRDGATCERVTFRGVRVGPRVDNLVEQVIGVRDPAADLGVIRDLVFDDVTAPSFSRPEDNWTWFAQFRPGRPQPGDAVHVFEGADELHAVEGLTLRGIVVNGRHLRDAATAQRLANLTIGPHVRSLTFE